MLYGNREKFLEMVRNNPDILQSISDKFNDDSDLLKAAGIFNSELTDNGEENKILTDDLGEVVDLIVGDYKDVNGCIKKMRGLQLDTINIISFLDEVDLDEDDIKKLYGKLEGNIESLKKLKAQIDEIISRNLASSIMTSGLAMENFNNSYSSQTNDEPVSNLTLNSSLDNSDVNTDNQLVDSVVSASEQGEIVPDLNVPVSDNTSEQATQPAISSQVPDIFEENLVNNQVKLDNNQFILGRNANGNYYLVIDPNMTPDGLENVKIQISQLKPELDSSQFIIDYGNALLDSSLEVLLNGYANSNVGVAGYEIDQNLADQKTR